MHCDRPDWESRVADRIMRRLHPGAVILLHDRLTAAGYRFDRQLPR